MNDGQGIPVPEGTEPPLDPQATAAEPQELQCTCCEVPLKSYYFELNGAPACESCRYAEEERFKVKPPGSGYAKAAAAGVGAGAVGAGIYYAILAFSGYEVGLVAILVGWMVGGAVKWGSGRRGGWGYQGLAMLVTYMAIVSTYIPMIFTSLAEMEPETEVVQASAPAEPGKPVAAGDAEPAVAAEAAEEPVVEAGLGDFVTAAGGILILAAALPFLAGVENLIGLVIIGVGVYQAWAMNKREMLAIGGPFRVGAPREQEQVPA